MTATLYESHAMCSPYDRWHSTNYVRSHELYWMNCVCSLHMWQRGPLRRSTAWPRQMARLQSSTGELLESCRIWSIRRVRSLPGRRLQLGPDGRQTDKSMCLWSAMCTGTSLSRRACVSKNRDAMGCQDFAQLQSTLLTSDSDEVKPANSYSIWRWHCTWKVLRFHVCCICNTDKTNLATWWWAWDADPSKFDEERP